MSPFESNDTTSAVPVVKTNDILRVDVDSVDGANGLLLSLEFVSIASASSVYIGTARGGVAGGAGDIRLNGQQPVQGGAESLTLKTTQRAVGSTRTVIGPDGGASNPPQVTSYIETYFG